MKLQILHGLPFVSVILTLGQQSVFLEHALVDTGSAGTLFDVESLERLGLEWRAEDPVRPVWGIGGVEYVVLKRLD